MQMGCVCAVRFSGEQRLSIYPVPEGFTWPPQSKVSVGQSYLMNWLKAL